MSHEITADWMTLMGQASATALTYHREALATIREAMGINDRHHPVTMEQVNAAIELAKVAADDFRSTCNMIAANKIAEALHEIGERN